MSFLWLAANPLRSREQVAREVHAVSLARGLDELATVIALMAISTEAGAKDSRGERQWWCPANRAVPESLNFPHDSESDDGRSMSYFQQQPGPNGEPWWGSTESMMTLPLAANMFLERLSPVYHRAADNPARAGQFAQAVQRSAYPDRYAEKWGEAWKVLTRALAEDQPAPQEEPPMGWTGDPIWLEDVLRPALGDRLATLDGWQHRGHGDYLDIRGVMVHHTGNRDATAESIRDGRPDLEGPLSNLHIATDGTATIVAVGVCWHAGRGSYPWLPTNEANWHMIGIECAHDGPEHWPDAQVIALRDTCAALTVKLGTGAAHVIGHKDYAGAAQGKWDPGNMSMSWLQGEVQKDMDGFVFPGEHPPITLPPTPDYAEEIWDQLRLEWRQLGGQTLVNAVAQIRDKVCGVTDYADWKAGLK